MHTASQAPPICQEDENEGVQGGVMGREGKTGESGSEGLKGGRRSEGGEGAGLERWSAKAEGERGERGGYYSGGAKLD